LSKNQCGRDRIDRIFQDEVLLLIIL